MKALSGKSSWSDLPPELLDLIADKIDRCDKKSARSVCRSWETSFSRNILSRVFISCHRPDLRAIDAFVKKRFLLQDVKELWWDDTTYNPDLLDLRIFQHQALGHIEEPCLECYIYHQLHSFGPYATTILPRFEAMQSRMTPQELEAKQHEIASEAFAFFQHECKYHLEARKNCEDYARLLTLLKDQLLPRLRRVYLTQLPWDDIDERIPSPAALHFAQKLPCREDIPVCEIAPRVDWHGEDVLEEEDLGASWSQDIQPPVTSDGDDHWHAPPVVSSARGLSLLLRGFALYPTPIEAFLVKSPNLQTRRDKARGINWRVLLDPCLHLGRMTNMFANLRHLRLELSSAPVRYPSAIKDDDSGKQLATAVNAAHRLESLRLHLDPKMRLSTFLKTLHAIPSLNRLDFHGATLETEYLVPLVQQLGLSSLTHLILSYCFLTTSSWAEVFRAWDAIFPKVQLCASWLQDDDLWLGDYPALNFPGNLEAQAIQGNEESRSTSQRLRRWIDGRGAYPFSRANETPPSRTDSPLEAFYPEQQP